MARLAIAWCLKNPNVSTVITGASRVEQVYDNLQALEVVDRLTDDVMEEIEEVLEEEEHVLDEEPPGAAPAPAAD